MFVKIILLCKVIHLVDGGVLPATAADYGTIKIGYTESGKNYPLELSNGKHL